MSTIWSLTKRAFRQWYADSSPRMAAALAFYMIFSIAPTFIIVVAITGAVVGEASAQGEVIGFLQEFIGPAGAEVIAEIGAKARSDSSGPVMLLAGLVTLVCGSTVAFSELDNALNTLWNVRSALGIKGFVRQRFVAFLIVVGLAVLVLLSVVASSALNVGIELIETVVGGSFSLLQSANELLSFALTTVALAMLYRYVPNTDIRWSDVWPGALLTAVLFSLGRQVTTVYLAEYAFGSVYGTAASLVAILLWVYYSAQVFFFGAEFTYVYTCERGSKAGASRTNS